MKKNPMKNTKKAVTLIELLTVIAIISIVASVSFATYSKTAELNRLNHAANFLRSMLDAARAYELQHPPSITGELTDSSWENNWKAYLKNYLGSVPETTTSFGNSLLRTAGNNPVEYSMDATGGVRKFRAWDTKSGSVLFIDWNGNATRATGTIEHSTNPGTGKGCLAPSDCNSGCLTSECVLSFCQPPHTQPDSTACGTPSVGLTCQSGECMCVDDNPCTTDEIISNHCEHTPITTPPILVAPGGNPASNECAPGKRCDHGVCKASGGVPM